MVTVAFSCSSSNCPQQFSEEVMNHVATKTLQIHALARRLAYVDAKKQGAVLGWGQFLTAALNFLIIASVLFLAIKGMNKLKREEPPAPAPEPSPEVKLLTEIRDLLKKK